MSDERTYPEPNHANTLSALIEEVAREALPDDGWNGLKPGAVVGRYELIRELGRGGFGVVWEARDRDLGRRVALKGLRVGNSVLRERRMLAEAEIAARLSHPNVVMMLDVGRSEHGVFIVQEFVPGESLDDRLGRKLLPVQEAVRIARDLARGLAHAHANGIVHRDLTTRNVQVTEDGQVKILDLGMASALGRRKLEGGTRGFMAPEQAKGAPEDERTDVFALGVVLYLMLVGVPPFSPDSDPATRVARGLAVPGSPALQALVEAMLEADPTRRPRDASAVLEELDRISGELASRATALPVRPRAPARIRWALAGATVGVVATVIAVAMVAGLAGAALRRPSPVFVSGRGDFTRCSWKQIAWHSLKYLPEGSIVRNGHYLSQQIAAVQGRTAWLQRPDWSQLFVPIGAEPDVFRVEVDFYSPEMTTYRRAPGVMVFTDPLNGDFAAELNHGIGIRFVQEPNRAPVFEWGVIDGIGTAVVDHKGDATFPFTDSWRTLRIDGSRSGCWLRVVLDDATILTSVGRCDLTGKYVMLGSNYGDSKPQDVAFSNLRIMEGGPECR
ncbi:MAG: serine/threonine-protein kinase [Anaeromyxobacter sp.]